MDDSVTAARTVKWQIHRLYQNRVWPRVQQKKMKITGFLYGLGLSFGLILNNQGGNVMNTNFYLFLLFSISFVFSTGPCG